MNALIRIKEIEKQAFDAVWNLDRDPVGPGTHLRPDGFEQKFAELVVLECAKVLLKWKDEPFPFDEHLAVRLIKDHFGVKS